MTLASLLDETLESWHVVNQAPMARPLRLEFIGAVYHMTTRGDRQEAIFLDDAFWSQRRGYGQSVVFSLP